MKLKAVSSVELYMARVYLTEARRTPHRAWAFTLLQWAANRRLAAMQPKGQMGLDL